MMDKVCPDCGDMVVEYCPNCTHIETTSNLKSQAALWRLLAIMFLFFFMGVTSAVIVRMLGW